MKIVATRACDRRDDAAGRTAVLRFDAAGFYLDFLKNFKVGVLTLLPLQHAAGRDTVDDKLVLGSARTIHLNSTFKLARTGVCRGQDQRLETASFRQSVKFFLRQV